MVSHVVFILGCAILIATIIIETFRRTLKRNQEKLKWAMKEHEKQMYEEKVRFLSISATSYGLR